MNAEEVTPAEPAPEPVLRLEGIVKSFGKAPRRVLALEGISAHIRAGTVTGLIGPDGAGKTTLMRVIAGLMLPDAGSVTVLGRDLPGESLAAQAELGYMPQRFGLYEDLTVRENLDLYADLQGLEAAARPARYAELMTMAGMAPFGERLAGHLSGGMKQKLGLACTLVRAPRLLLLDEPSVGVDPVSRRELWAMIYRQVREHGMSVLLSTAYLDEAGRCDEVLLLHQGRLIGQDAPGVFTRALEGRTWKADAGSLGKRGLQQRLSQAPGVVDALIQGEHVRLVMEDARELSPCRLLAEVPDLHLARVAPRFEDSFISLIRASDGAGRAMTLATQEKRGRGDGAVIEARDLSRTFGDFQAVRNISFSVRHGEIFGLLGANGAGKTTTFRMLCGLLPVSGGQVRVAGVDLRTAAARARARIGYMAQRFSLYGSLSVSQNLRFFSHAYGLQARRSRLRIDWALEQFDLREVIDMNGDELPLGYKQRLAMAAALLHEPDILFLDEPTSGVDPLARREFWQRINALAESGVAILVTTHFMEEAEFCDRLVIMAEGDILATGTPAEVKAAARTPELAEPSMEDAFIALIERPQRAGAAA